MAEEVVRILVLSFYFRPDLCAGSFRTAALIDALDRLASSGIEIEVLTTLPNRYESFSQEAAEVEKSGRLEIRRIPLPRHRNDMLGHCRAFLKYSRSVSTLTALRSYDLVFATSSRLMTATLAARIARAKKLPLYLDVRDIFVDSIQDILPWFARLPVRSVFGLVESCTMSRACHINLVSRGFEAYFSSRYPRPSYSFFTNGIDDEFLQKSELVGETQVNLPGKKNTRILYAGNIGEGQSLHSIIPGLAKSLGDEVEFVVIGDGGRKARLVADTAGLDNVVIRRPVARRELIAWYRGADALFLHLADRPAFEKVLPSKVFEYGAVGKPILAGVAGFAANFIRSEMPNAAVFSPGDVQGAVRAFRTLEFTHTRRKEFIERYSRSRICLDMAQGILSLLPKAN